MDRQSIIGFVVIAILITGWMVYVSNQSVPPPPPKQTAAQQIVQDSIQAREKAAQEAMELAAAAVRRDSVAQDRLGAWFSGSDRGDERDITVRTSKYTAVLSTRGGSIRFWTLNEFKTWNQMPLQLVDRQFSPDANLMFLTSDSRLIDTRDLMFRSNAGGPGGVIDVKDSATATIEFLLPVRGDSACIVKRYIVKGGSYSADMDIEMRGMAGVIANGEYEVSLHSPNLTEQNTVDEAGFSEANVFIGGERHTLDVSGSGSRDSTRYDGKAEWISIHNKYFISALIAKNDNDISGAFLRGEHIPLRDNGSRELYLASMRVRIGQTAVETTKLTLFMGPLKYGLLKEQHEGLEQVISLGWAWIVRPFSEYFIIPLFTFLHSFIPNFGLVILVFTLIIKLLLHPLTRSSMKSMRKMQALQPLMTEIREKYKDDQQRQNTEIMKLYKDYGVNPAGGCLPMLLQMPILFALFAIFRSTFELRQQPFVLWIKDLSAPDIILNLPFTIPVLGMTFISGLALAMAVTMFFQQKQSVTDPRQKSMIYMMPAMFWIMFNAFPSGLNLYYFLFNLLSIGQQYYVNKKHESEPLQKVEPKKRQGKSWSERMMSSLDEKAKQQQKARKR
jgi:YidC/Oxa1 family membrane protein insertase